MLPRDGLREMVCRLVLVGFRVGAPPQILPRGRSLFACRRCFLRSCRRSPLAPPASSLPLPPQAVGDVSPVEMFSPRDSILEQTGIVEILAPAGEQLFT